jgi:hypothetical protein
MINGGNVMKKKLLSLFSVSLVLVLLCTTFFAGCFGLGESSQTYTIQYTDESGTHTLEVESNMPYSIESIPTKTGYEFMGLFDAEEGGTQYVSANGSSLSSFTAKKNMVLFPQYKAKEYTVILDYQGAVVSGSRQLTVSYGSSLPELPTNLQSEHNNFTGWYTKEGCKGTQVADLYGLIPLVSVLNETNFNLSDNSPIYLYAGFEAAKYTVTFHFTQDLATEEVQVSYNTAINQVGQTTRNSNGEAVLTWSTTPNDTTGDNIFSGKVTGDMDLYAVEWAPVIELDTNGGNSVNSIVAKAGATVSLPTPTKDMAKFLYWETSDGSQANITTMPTKSIKLKAVWQAKIVFDVNGGTDVIDISEKAGTQIALPIPNKENYLFAGWYTSDKEQYTSTTMPSEGITLKAGWYVAKQVERTVISATTYDNGYNTSASTDSLCYRIALNDLVSDGKKITVYISANAMLCCSNSSLTTCYAGVYLRKSISTNYYWDTITFEDVVDTYKNFKFSFSVTNDDDAYICFYYPNSKYWSTSNRLLYIKDFNYTLSYPDTTTLYL